MCHYVTRCIDIHMIIVSDNTLTREDLIQILKQPQPVAQFNRCSFDGQDLTSLDLRNIRFTACSLVEARLSHSTLSETAWERCKIGLGDFELADLTAAQFMGCDLHMTKWARARMSSATFADSKLTGASFLEARCLGLTLRNCLLVSSNLRGLSFRKQKLEQLDFSDADLGGCDFRNTVFNGGSLRGASLKGAQFQGADLRTVELGAITVHDLTSYLQGSVISAEQGEQLLESLGVRVM